MFQLRKEYPGTGGNPPHVAVESISLAVERNECFGLLGPNGKLYNINSITSIMSCILFVCVQDICSVKSD